MHRYNTYDNPLNSHNDKSRRNENDLFAYSGKNPCRVNTPLATTDSPFNAVIFYRLLPTKGPLSRLPLFWCPLHGYCFDRNTRAQFSRAFLFRQMAAGANANRVTHQKCGEECNLCKNQKSKFKQKSLCRLL